MAIKKLDKLPDGWKYYPAEASRTPNGYRLAYNGKSRWSGDFKSAWVKDYSQVVYWKRIKHDEKEN